MANSFVRYTGDGNTSTYSIPFSYRVAGDLTVTLNAVATTAFTFNAAGTTITFNSPPANSAAIEIRRTTSQATRLTDYASGSVLTESDLDTDSTQSFFMSQEAIDDAADKIKIDPADFQWDATSKRIKNVAAPTADTDAVNRAFISTNIPNITTVSGIASDVTTVAGISANVTTVAGNNANVTTVAGSIANVNTVATNIANVNTVANDLNEAISEIETAALDLQEATSEIDVVAANIANVNTVGGIDANVTTVAGISGNVTTVAGIASDVSSVAGINAAVSAVNSNSSNINAVNSNSANINTVAGNNANVTTVAGISSNVTTVAGISSDVTAVAGDATDIGAVAAKATEIGLLGTADAVSDMNTLGTAQNVTNMNTLAGISANITTAAGNDANITTVAGNNSNITTVAGISGNVTTVAGIASDVTAAATNNANITTVAGAIANVNTVGGAIANVNTVATNVAGVNSFADRYRVAASDPSSSLDAGDLVFNTSANALKYYDGASWNAIVAGALSDVVQDGSPQLGGNLDLNSNDITGTGNINITGGVTMSGDLTVNGTTTTINSTTLTVDDKNITLASGAADSSAADGAGLTVDGASATLTYTHSGTKWNVNKDFDVTGNIIVSGTVDGRDLQTDGTKLDGIEAAADVTDATNVDAAGAIMNSDVATKGQIIVGDGTGDPTILSVGTDGHYLKADSSAASGVAWASIPAVDAAAVTAAGALMDSEVTNLAQVKAFDSSDYATAAQGTTADAALPKAGGTMTGDISHASDFALDIGGDITLDADGGKVRFKDAGTEIGRVVIDNNQDLEIVASVQDKDIKFRGDDGGTGITALTLDMSDAGTAIFGGWQKMADDNRIVFGAGSDLAIYHDSSNNISFINEAGAGNLHIRGGNIIFKSQTDNDDYIKCIEDGAVELYYNNAKMFSTTSQGVQVEADKRLVIINGNTWSGELVGKIEHHANNMYHQFNSNFICRNSSGSNVFTLDSSGNGTFNANVSAYSDLRLKEDVKTIDNALDKVSKLRGVEYTRKETKAREIGVIAQEVKEIIPELVTIENTKSDINPEGLEDLHTMKYANTVGLLIEAIKELKVDLDNHKKHCTCGASS